MDIPLDEVIYVEAISSSSTGAAADADSTPTFAVYEEATDTDIGVGGNMTKRTSLTGDYRASFTASAANGFELGKWYSVIGSATIGAIATKGVLARFRIVAAENTAGYPLTDAAKWNNLATVALPLIPTVAGRSLDVAATGEAGLDFNNVLSSALVTLHSLTVTNALTASNASNSVNLGTDSIGSTQLASSGITEIRDAITGGAYALSTDANGRIRIVDGTAAGELDTSSGLVTLAGTQTFNNTGTWTGNITGNLSGSVGSVTGNVGGNVTGSVGSISGVSFPSNFSSLGINASGHVSRVTLTDTLTTYTGDTPQTGDSFARIGATGSGLTSLPAMILDLTDGIETGVTLRQAQRAMAAVLIGKIADAGTGTETFKSIGGTTTRVVATVDASGNRSAMTLSL